jgi:hypothetical protein
MVTPTADPASVTASTPTSDQSGPPRRSRPEPADDGPAERDHGQSEPYRQAVPGLSGAILRTAAHAGVSQCQRATHTTRRQRPPRPGAVQGCASGSTGWLPVNGNAVSLRYAPPP